MTKRTKLADRVTPEQLDDLRNRRITTRALAVTLGVSENHLSKVFPGKIPGPAAESLREKRRLKAIRKEFRDRLALDVLFNRLTIRKAASQANCTERNMYRHVAAMKPVYKAHMDAQAQPTAQALQEAFQAA